MAADINLENLQLLPQFVSCDFMPENPGDGAGMSAS